MKRKSYYLLGLCLSVLFFSSFRCGSKMKKPKQKSISIVSPEIKDFLKKPSKQELNEIFQNHLINNEISLKLQESNNSHIKLNAIKFKVLNSEGIPIQHLFSIKDYKQELQEIQHQKEELSKLDQLNENQSLKFKNLNEKENLLKILMQDHENLSTRTIHEITSPIYKEFLNAETKILASLIQQKLTNEADLFKAFKQTRAKVLKDRRLETQANRSNIIIFSIPENGNVKVIYKNSISAELNLFKVIKDGLIIGGLGYYVYNEFVKEEENEE